MLGDVDVTNSLLPSPLGPKVLLRSNRDGSTPISVVTDLIDQYGDFVRYRTQFGEFYLVNHPLLIRDVLCSPDCVRNRLLSMVLGKGVLSSNGEHWMQQRRLMLPVFKPRQIESMVETFRNVALERAESWRTRLHMTNRIDVSKEMFRIALSSLGRVLFQTEFDDHFLAAVDIVMREVSIIQNAATFGYPLIRQPNSQREFKDAMHDLDDAVSKLIDRSGLGKCPHSSLLSILQGDSPGGASLSRQQIRDEILTMILAGHETTAVALTWALYAVARHADASEPFYREVDRVIGRRSLSENDVSHLRYTRMIVDETLRLYPPVWFVAREAARDVNVGGQVIPAGSGILICPFALHRHAGYWAEPEQFMPERFAEGATQPLPYSYIPFFAGRHVCLGKHFALSEMVTVLATLSQNFSFRTLVHSPPEFEPLASLRIRGGLSLEVSTRHGVVGC